MWNNNKCCFLYFSYKAIGKLEFEDLIDFPIKLMPVVLSICFFIVGCFFRACTWNKGFNREISSFISFKAVCIGMAVSMTMPFKMGEAARVFVMGKDKKVKYSNIILNLSVERFIDVIILVSLSMIIVFIVGFNSDFFQRLIMLRKTIIISIIALTVIIATIFKVKKTWFLKISDFVKQIDIIKKPLLMINVIIYLLLSWFSMYLSGVFVILSTGMGYVNALGAALVILVLTNLVMLLPAAPGGIGVFQYAVIYSLGLYSVTGVHAAVLAVLMHLVQYAAVLPLGLYFFITGKCYKGSNGESNEEEHSNGDTC